MERGKRTGNTGTPAANAAIRKKGNTPGSQGADGENEKGRPRKRSGVAGFAAPSSPQPHVDRCRVIQRSSPDNGKSGGSQR
jgi:hypothetical protein